MREQGSPADISGVWHYLRVAVERGLDQGGSGSGLTYKSASPVEIGRRVEVPLGRGNTRAAGIVIQIGGVELLDGLSPAKVKAILEDTGAGLPEHLIELAKWISSYYVCPLGMVLGSMLPAAVKHRTGLRMVRVVTRVSAETEHLALQTKLPPQAHKAWQQIIELPESTWPIRPELLALQLGSSTLAPINKLVRQGLLSVLDIEDVRQTGGVPTQMGIEQTDPLGGAGMATGRHTATHEQQNAIDGITQQLGTFGVHVLHGVTGSGKTEVYLRVLEHVLARGQTALVLVPEISLTPQTSGRFIERFRAAGVAVMHSGLSASQRHKEWTRAASGGAKVVVGARSAVFAPLDRIGLIIVDEEHASDYKQDQLPRYHGRDVAIKRGHLEDCPVILGSATPSLETWLNATAKVTGSGNAATKYHLWQLRERVGQAKLPRVDVVDLTQERRLRIQQSGKRDAHQHLLGPTLEQAMFDTLRVEGQVLLLMNRRGYASYIACPDTSCGWFLSCEECDAKMVQHRVIAGQAPPKGVVRCHHCLAQRLLPEHCPQCQNRLITLGFGTQGVEMELAKKFGHLCGGVTDDAGVLSSPGIVRVDGDTMSSAKEYFDLLKRFASGEVKVLIGTQMIAKGLDFPNVRLVGVINADTALSLPDFRCSERTFQLVSQVAGRAGRGSIPGRVIVQTFDPTTPAITFAAEHDFEGFARAELQERHAARLPPFVRMARIVFRDEDLKKAEAAAERTAGAIRLAAENRAGTDALAILGPMPCPIARIAGHHRLSLELTSQTRRLLQDVLADVRAQGLCVSDSHTAVDIDPIALT